MEQKLEILVNEYNQLRESERSIRGHLHQINGFAVAVVSGLLIGISVYKIGILALVGPLVFYFVGFFWSSEVLRLLRVLTRVRRVEREVQRVISSSGDSIRPGFEDEAHPGHGLLHLLRYSNMFIAGALFYGIFYLMFFYLLFQTNYGHSLKILLIAAYLFFGMIFWGFDLWTNRHYLLRPPD